GDLDGVLEVCGDLLRERDDEMATECFGDSGEGVDAVPRSAALLEAGDHRLRRSHAFGELTLAEPGARAQVVDELTEGEVVLHLRTHDSTRRAAALLHVVPARVVGHRHLLHGLVRAQSSAAL